MAWLTDSSRREREWLPRVQAQQNVSEFSVTHLPSGGLRLEMLTRQGNLLIRQEIEDVAAHDGTIDRILRGEATRGRARTRWVVEQRITAEFQGAATKVTVRALGRPVGRSLGWHLLGTNDTATARALTTQAAQWTDFVVMEVAGHFGQDGADRNE